MAFPLTAAPSLSNWQMQYNGLTIGASTPYAVYQLDGLDLPQVRTGDLNRPREHGEFVGLDLMSGRDIMLTGDYQSDGINIQDSQQNLGRAFIPGGTTEQPFWFQFPNLPVLASMVRVRKRTMPIDQPYSVAAMGQLALMMHSSDPRLYGPVQSGSCGVGQALGGGIFPATFPYVFSSGSVAGTVVANNAGNVEMRPLLTITGPVTNPTIFNATAGWQITITNPLQVGYTVLAGDTLVIDTDTHAITYYTGGVGVGAARRAWLAAGSTWPSTVLGVPGLAPGSNTFQFTSTDGISVAGTLQVQWASAYLL